MSNQAPANGDTKQFTFKGRRYTARPENVWAMIGQLVAANGGMPDPDCRVSDIEPAEGAPDSNGPVSPPIDLSLADELPPSTPRSAPSPRLETRDTRAADVAVVTPPRAPLTIADSPEVERDRVAVDHAAMRDAGFSPPGALVSYGATNIDKARRKRLEFDAKPEASAALASLIGTVRAERRVDRDVCASSLSMGSDGTLVADGQIVPLTREAFDRLCSVLGFGGGAYLAKCWPALRAHNVNEWLDALRVSEAEGRAKAASKRGGTFDQARLKLRERNAGAGREVYAVTSTSYAPFDVDMMAEAVNVALARDNKGGKAEIHYDGTRARIDVSWHSNVAPEKMVAGEVTRAGVTLRTDDTGGGSIKGGGMLWWERCANMSILTASAFPCMRIRHTGSVHELARRFRAGFQQALDSVEHFRTLWGVAQAVDIRANAETGGETLEGKRLSEVLPGFFSGLIGGSRPLVAIPGRKGEVIEKLVSAWEWDTSTAKQSHQGFNRAAIVNAVTRAAHTTLDLDPWQQAEVEADASALIASKRPMVWAPV